MSNMQFICDVCNSKLFSPLFELNAKVENHTYRLEQSDIKGWKCVKCGEIYPQYVDISSQKIYKYKDSD